MSPNNQPIIGLLAIRVSSDKQGLFTSLITSYATPEDTSVDLAGIATDRFGAGTVVPITPSSFT